jgi:shikimate dehydrogenase
MERERVVVGLVGAGIGTSASPGLHEREADLLGIRYAYQVIDIDEIGVTGADVGELVLAARRLRFQGLNVTHPCKQFVVPHLDELSVEASAVGAVNTVVFDGERAIGHNTDILGFAESFRRGLPDALHDRIVVLGCGGAGAAVAYATLSLGAAEVVLVDLDDARATALAERLGAVFEPGRLHTAPLDRLEERLAAANGLVHATPTGMSAHPGVPFSPDLLRRDLWVADVVYRPLDTPLLQQARSLGCRTLDGGGMAVFQAYGSLKLFTGLEPDAERMLTHFDRVYRVPAVPDDPSAAATVS